MKDCVSSDLGTAADARCLPCPGAAPSTLRQTQSSHNLLTVLLTPVYQ